MSCYIVDNDHMNRILKFINENHKKDWLPSATSYETSKKILERARFTNKLGTLDPVNQKQFLEELGHFLFEYNFESWNTRYPHSLQTYKKDFILNLDSTPVVSLGEYFKLVECLDYQCTDIDDYFKSDCCLDFKYLMKFGTEFAEGYEEAQWGT